MYIKHALTQARSAILFYLPIANHIAGPSPSQPANQEPQLLLEYQSRCAAIPQLANYSGLDLEATLDNLIIQQTLYSQPMTGYITTILGKDHLQVTTASLTSGVA